MVAAADEAGALARMALVVQAPLQYAWVYKPCGMPDTVSTCSCRGNKACCCNACDEDDGSGRNACRGCTYDVCGSAAP